MPHLYLQLQEQLRQWIKPKDKRHLQGFAESVAAILQSGSASLSHFPVTILGDVNCHLATANLDMAKG